MLIYLWLLLPVLAQAAHRGHAPRRMASSMAWSTGTATPSASDDPCKRVYLTAQLSNDSSSEPEVRVPAKLAYECLNSIPFNQTAAAALLESMRPYLEWQSTTSYVKDPPEKPPYDFWSAFEAVEANVAHGAYDSEYDFGWDLYQATQQAHDEHFVYIPDVLLKLFSFGRKTPLVSVSKDGKASPKVYLYSDILESYAGNSSFEPSHIIQINRDDTKSYLLDQSQYGTGQDKDALWNSLFYSQAQVSLGGRGMGSGAFTGNGDGRFVYPGPNTLLLFANMTEVTYENFARVLVSLDGIDDGMDMYQKFLIPSPEAYNNALDVLHRKKKNQIDDDQHNNDTRVPYHKRSIRPSYVDEVLSSQRHTPTTPAIGYPSPIIRQKQNMNGGYFLEEPGLEDVAVLTVASFMTPGATRAQDFQKINSDFIAAALAANKTKLIIDVSANGGSSVIQGYDLFKQLFPSIEPYGAHRMRAHETISWVGELCSTPVNHSDHYGVSQGDDPENSMWNYRNDLDSDNKQFKSWEQKFGPHPHGPGNDTFTSLIRWKLDDERVFKDSGIWVSGYGDRSNMTHQPFQPQNIVLVTDGFCASTCALFSEFLHHEAGVQTVTLGGRPSWYHMQGVGGTKGAQMYTWTNIFETVQGAIRLSNPAQQQSLNKSALSRYSYLPIARGLATVNLRDGIRRNDDEQTPYQFLYEPAQCRIFYTKQMVMDPSAVWKTVADSVWGDGNACIDDINSGKQGNITAEGEMGGQKVWSVRNDFDIEEAWKGLQVETDRDWFGVHGDYVAIV
ncbi:hypothetical protein E4T52_05626 [Aureobasidium sp. EXF-3400]|nr:hypothetical protein E4T51_04801 [Aureobasidium sp. EXF-12344]KAI4779436.1 hypothetical protein E4T52_05626 [Aureobasidium sp. EXF-3400]